MDFFVEGGGTGMDKILVPSDPGLEIGMLEIDPGIDDGDVDFPTRGEGVSRIDFHQAQVVLQWIIGIVMGQVLSLEDIHGLNFRNSVIPV